MALLESVAVLVALVVTHVVTLIVSFVAGAWAYSKVQDVYRTKQAESIKRFYARQQEALKSAKERANAAIKTQDELFGGHRERDTVRNEELEKMIAEGPH